jgi:hypothetical protein
MKTPLILTLAGAAALAAGLAGAQTYSTYPSSTYGSPYGYANSAVRVVRCESNDSRRTFCAVDTRGGVELYRQLSRRDCVRGRNWQAGGNGITVTDGCRAEFVLGAGYDGRYPYNGSYPTTRNGTYNGIYSTDRYGRPIYDNVYGTSDVGYTTDQYGRRIYDARSRSYNGMYTTDRYGRRIYVPQAYPQDRPYYPVDDRYSRNGDPYAYGPGYDPGPYASSGYAETIQCVSSAYGRTYCGDRNVHYSLGNGAPPNCVEGRTFGRDAYGTWVSGGCNLLLVPTGYEH